MTPKKQIKQYKGDIYNLRNLKVVLDDALYDFITKTLSLKIKTAYTDFELFVGTISTILSIIVVYMSCNYDFCDYKLYLIICLTIYFILNGIITICNYFRSTTFAFDGMKVCTEICPPYPVYTILVYRNGKLIPEKFSKSVYDLFDCEGILSTDCFYKELNVFIGNENVK